MAESVGSARVGVTPGSVPPPSASGLQLRCGGSRPGAADAAGPELWSAGGGRCQNRALTGEVYGALAAQPRSNEGRSARAACSWTPHMATWTEHQPGSCVVRWRRSQATPLPRAVPWPSRPGQRGAIGMRTCLRTKHGISRVVPFTEQVSRYIVDYSCIFHFKSVQGRDEVE